MHPRGKVWAPFRSYILDLSFLRRERPSREYSFKFPYFPEEAGCFWPIGIGMEWPYTTQTRTIRITNKLLWWGSCNHVPLIFGEYFFLNWNCIFGVLDDPLPYGSVQQHINPLTLDGGAWGCLETNLELHYVRLFWNYKVFTLMSLWRHNCFSTHHFTAWLCTNYKSFLSFGSLDWFWEWEHSTVLEFLVRFHLALITILLFIVYFCNTLWCFN